MKALFFRALPWAALDSVGGAGLRLVALLILSRVLTPAEFGLVAYVQAFVALITIGVEAGLREALIQRRDVTTLHENTAFWAAAGFGALGYTICLLAAWYWWSRGGNWIFTAVLAAEGATCLFTGLNIVPLSYFERTLRFAVAARRTLISRSAYVCIAAVLAFLGYGIWSIVAAGFAQNLVSTIVLWSAMPQGPRYQFSRGHLRELLAFGVPAMLEGALWAVQARVFLLLVGVIHDLETLGIVSLALRTADVIAGVLGTIASQIGLPIFALLRDRLEEMKTSFAQATEGLLLVSTPIFLGLVLTAPDWVPLFLGAKWMPAVPSIQIVCIVWAILFTRMFVGSLLKALGRPRVMLLPAALASLVTFAGVFLTAGMPPTSIMLAWASRLLVTFPAGVILVHRVAKLAFLEQMRPLMWPALTGGAMLLAAWALRASLAQSEALVRLSATAALGGIVYVLFVLALYRRHLPQLLGGAKA